VNAELCKRAAEKVGNPNVLVNLISRRVRQLNSGGGGLSRPLVGDITNLGVADIALREILEDKMGWKCRSRSNWSVRRPRNAGNAEVPNDEGRMKNEEMIHSARSC